jgi:hypothetical protein
MHAAYAYTLADPVSFTSTRERSGVERERVAERERERERETSSTAFTVLRIWALTKKKPSKVREKNPQPSKVSMLTLKISKKKSCLCSRTGHLLCSTKKRGAKKTIQKTMYA